MGLAIRRVSRVLLGAVLATFAWFCPGQGLCLDVDVAGARALGSPSLSETPDRRFSVTKTIRFDTEHIFRGIQTAEISLQPEVLMSYGNFYAGFRGNMPMIVDETRYDRQIEAFAGVLASVSHWLTADIGVRKITVPIAAPRPGATPAIRTTPAALRESGLAMEPFVRLIRFGTVQPSVAIFRNIDENVTTVEGELSHSRSLRGHLQAALSGRAGQVVGEPTVGSYAYYSLGLDLAHKIMDRAVLVAGTRWSGASSDFLFADAERGRFKNTSVRWSVALRTRF